MDNAWWSILIFLFTTFVYYYLVPSPTMESFSSGQSSNYTYLAIYVFVVMLGQFGLNAAIINSTCGGTTAETLSSAGFYTFIPWTLVFGVLALILIVYPGFKSAFSDVVGYFWVSGGVKKILDTLLMNAAPSADSKDSDSNMQSVSDMIVKIYSNNSLLVNQIVPSNFDKYWGILQPLMKPEYRGDGGNELKGQFFQLVTTRDKIGECMWYLYAGVLVVSLVQLNIATGGCVSSPATMARRNQQFLAESEAANKKKQLAASTTYKIAA